VATKLPLTDSAPSTLTLGSGTRALKTTAGSAQVNSDATPTAVGPSKLGVKKGGVQLLWTSDPVNAFTLDGPVTANVWMSESAAAANAGAEFAVDLFTQAGTFIRNVLASAKGTELPTAMAAQNWTANPGGADHSVPQGAIIVVSLFLSDAGGTMAAGNTVTASYNGPTGAANGDSWIQFTENITFVAGSAPANTSPPTISGTPEIGNTLTGADGTWTGDTSRSSVWKRDTTTIIASGSSYQVAAADAGHTLIYEVTAANANGSTVASSAAVTVATAIGVITPPSISVPAGGPKVGQTLTLSPGVYDKTITSRAQQWLRSTDNGETWLPIGGAVDTTYTLTPEDRPNGTTIIDVDETVTA
jgi:hypothetical protein